VHAYASELGLDANRVAREFLERFGDPDAGTPPSPPALPSGSLRLLLADAPPSFTGGRLLLNPPHRLAAAVCDLALVLALAAGMWTLVDSFWTPAGCIALFYWLTSVLVLGNTPGVCLLTSAVSHEVPSADDGSALVTSPAISAISSSP
jgi:hypothetical protein